MLQPHMREYVWAKPVAEDWTVTFTLATKSAKSRTRYWVYDVPKIPGPKLMVLTGHEQTDRSTHI